jgi:hypothetical protein
MSHGPKFAVFFAFLPSVASRMEEDSDDDQEFTLLDLDQCLSIRYLSKLQLFSIGLGTIPNIPGYYSNIPDPHNPNHGARNSVYRTCRGRAQGFRPTVRARIRLVRIRVTVLVFGGSACEPARRAHGHGTI